MLQCIFDSVMSDFDWFLRVLISFNQSEVNVYLTKNKHDLKKNIHIIGSYPKPDGHDRRCMDFMR